MDELYYKFRNFILKQENPFYRMDLVNTAIEEGLFDNKEEKDLENIEILYFALDDLLSENLIFSRTIENTKDNGDSEVLYQFVVNDRINDFDKKKIKKKI